MISVLYSSQVIDAWIECKRSKAHVPFRMYSFIVAMYQLMPIEINKFHDVILIGISTHTRISVHEGFDTASAK